MTKPWIVFSASVAGALVLVWLVQTALWTEIPLPMVSAAYAVIVMSSGLGSKMLREHLLAKGRVDESAGLERDLSVTARAGSVGDLLLVCLGVGGIFLLSGNTIAGLGCIGLVIIAMISVETRVAMLRRRQPANR
ncbi:hypothetical protein [Plantibacter cousiniae (nom. nud.)]|uniref:Uncharacterized protein n=1 Tax=Plantibacter cousiniae (nom. nud.) TaxID=199709 RepID=A0ABY1LNG1_9MICO|nr:hypothetical protein [Plantibacter cousiniae]SKC68353.1 hypothetical protein SAMN06295973_2814 [Plantibacter cousiniae]